MARLARVEVFVGWPWLAVFGLPGSQRDEKLTHFQTFQLPVSSSPR